MVDNTAIYFIAIALFLFCIGLSGCLFATCRNRNHSFQYALNDLYLFCKCNCFSQMRKQYKTGRQVDIEQPLPLGPIVETGNFKKMQEKVREIPELCNIADCGSFGSGEYYHLFHDIYWNQYYIHELLLKSICVP